MGACPRLADRRTIYGRPPHMPRVCGMTADPCAPAVLCRPHMSSHMFADARRGHASRHLQSLARSSGRMPWLHVYTQHDIHPSSAPSNRNSQRVRPRSTSVHIGPHRSRSVHIGPHRSTSVHIGPHHGPIYVCTHVCTHVSIHMGHWCIPMSVV